MNIMHTNTNIYFIIYNVCKYKNLNNGETIMLLKQYEILN